MAASRYLRILLVASGLSRGSNDGQPVAESFGPSLEVAQGRAPQIFNAVHDAMRQWGESLHHNGMSFFLATVPEGVILHHGNNNEESPREPDWLAYEVEHAEGFARGGFGGPGGGPGRGPPGKPPAHYLRSDNLHGQVELGSIERAQEPMIHEVVDERPLEEVKGGWLHTYRVVRPLRYLYVDGMSGGKTSMGTLDSQDYLLRGTKEAFEDLREEGDQVHSPPPPPGGGGGGPMNERARAVELCALCKDWNLSGIVRMEAGFEIIQCDFSDGLEQLHVSQRPPSNGGRGPGRGGSIGNFEFLRGLSERYYDIGSARTFIDYSSMTSAFFFPVNLTNPDPARPDLPRLSNTTDAELLAIQARLNQTILDRISDPIRTVDWRDVTDLIVGRYADRIRYMVEKTHAVSQIADEIDFLLTAIIDFSGKDRDQTSAAIDRCANFYLHGVNPVTESDELIRAAIHAVTSEICTKLFDVRALVTGESNHDADASSTLPRAVAILTSLMTYLDWTRFKRCGSCEVHEVCFVPMWPMGTKKDYDSPRCVNASSQNDHGGGYWGGFGRPGHGPGDGKGGRGEI